MITLTENAAKEIRKIMQEQQLEENVFIRVGVKGGGCSGFTYTFDFDARKTRFDLDFESQESDWRWSIQTVRQYGSPL